MCSSCSRVPLGHIPHVVSRHLAPLVRSQQIVVEAVVQEEPLTETAPLLVELQVIAVCIRASVHVKSWVCMPSSFVGTCMLLQCQDERGEAPVSLALTELRTCSRIACQVAMQPAAPSASPGAARRAAAMLRRAEAAAAAQLQQQPQATGERLHSNFLTVLATVERHDGHLLAESERGFIAAYKVRLPGNTQRGWAGTTRPSLVDWAAVAALKRTNDFLRPFVNEAFFIGCAPFAGAAAAQPVPVPAAVPAEGPALQPGLAVIIQGGARSSSSRRTAGSSRAGNSGIC